MPRILDGRRRVVAVPALLIAAFLATLAVPIPALPDVGRGSVRAEIAQRLPGWEVQRVDPSWEGAYTVVTTCAGKRVSFQFVPGHGLPSRDAWLRPSNSYARQRLTLVSDHYRWLIWRDEPRDLDRLSCSEELARTGDEPVPERALD